MNVAPPQIRLQIVTPEARVFEGDAAFVELPTMEGQLGVYPGHVRLMVGVGTGEIRVHTADAIESFIVLGGYAEIDPGWMTVLALFASPQEEKVKIDEAVRRAQDALELAENLPPEQAEDGLAWLRIELARSKKNTTKSRS